jgi:hypothetical protein
MKTVYVLMVEWSRGSGDFKDFSQHDSYSSAEWAARQQRASGANCVIVPRTVAEGSGSATGTGGKGGLHWRNHLDADLRRHLSLLLWTRQAPAKACSAPGHASS